MQYNRRMTTNSAAILKDVRNIKRFQSYTNKKDAPKNWMEGKTADTPNKIDLTSFMDNKNEKINNIDAKLEMHNVEIQKNHDIINQLNHDFVHLKEHLDKQREATLAQIKKNHILKEQINKSNNTLKLKNSKIEEYCDRIIELEKQNKDIHILTANNTQQSKMIATLKTQIASMQQNIDNLTLTIIQKNQETKKQKQKNDQLHQQNTKGKQSLLNQKLQSKDSLIRNLKQTIKDLTLQITNTLEQKNIISHKLMKIETQIGRYQEETRILQTSIRTLTIKQNQYKSQLQSLANNSKEGEERIKYKEQELANLKLNVNELKLKFNELNLLCDKRQKEIALKDNKIDKMSIKMKQLQNCIGDNYKEKDKLKSAQDKFQNVKNKMQNLQNAYSSISPQIQCPFGHQLKSAVTIIPCGHNYCLNCKKGYAKDCLQCNGKLKIEAVYRNELMDDIIGMVTAIRHIIEVIQ